jgi:ribA/ribD-fused uncharacterized protein
MNIVSFRKEYSFLSNFYKCSFVYKNIIFDSSERAFQWEKIESDSDKLLVLETKSTSEVKKLAGILKMRSDWESVKCNIMYEILLQKFSNELLKKLLLDTIGHKLVEGNSWHDNFWGDCFCTRCKKKIGKNNLGFILQRVRSHYSGGNHPFFCLD